MKSSWNCSWKHVRGTVMAMSMPVLGCGSDGPGSGGNSAGPE